MARLSLTGTIQFIDATKSFGSNGFCKRDIIVMEEGTKYPNPVKFTLKKENCALADNFHEGDKVTVSASVNGREWTNPKNNTTSFFVDLDAYKLEDANEPHKGGKKGKGVPPPAVPSADEFDGTADDDGSPF